MIKDIVVNLSVSEGGSPAGDYAVSVADALKAHLAAIAFVYDPIIPVSGAGYMPPEVIETQQADNEAGAKAAVDRFTESARRAGLSAEPVALTASLAGAGDQFGRLARRFDLAIVGQSEPETSSVEDIIAETTLFDVRPAADPGALYPERPAETRQCHGLLGRQPAGGARHRRCHAATGQIAARRSRHRHQ